MTTHPKLRSMWSTSSMMSSWLMTDSFIWDSAACTSVKKKMRQGSGVGLTTRG